MQFPYITQEIHSDQISHDIFMVKLPIIHTKMKELFYQRANWQLHLTAQKGFFPRYDVQDHCSFI